MVAGSRQRLRVRGVAQIASFLGETQAQIHGESRKNMSAFLQLPGNAPHSAWPSPSLMIDQSQFITGLINIYQIIAQVFFFLCSYFRLFFSAYLY